MLNQHTILKQEEISMLNWNLNHTMDSLCFLLDPNKKVEDLSEGKQSRLRDSAMFLMLSGIEPDGLKFKNRLNNRAVSPEKVKEILAKWEYSHY